MITRIIIEGYKSIQKQDVELLPINILIGGNGIGKSNFISTFSLVRNLYEGNLQNYVRTRGGSDAMFYMGKKNTNKISLDLYFEKSSEDNRFIVNLVEAQDSLLIDSVKTAYKNNTWYIREYENNKIESSFRKQKSGQAYYVNELLQEFEVYHFHDTGEKSAMKGKSNINDNITLKRDGSNIAAFLYYLQEKHPKHFQRIEKVVASISPFFDSFSLRPDRLSEEVIQLEWRQKGKYDTYFNAYQLSDGTLRFICLATLFLQPIPPKTIIIDEPELGLHPQAINKLAALIKKASNISQVIISTQSVNLVDNFEAEDIITVNQEHNATTFRRLRTEELEKWLCEYSLGEIWEKNIIGANV